MAIGYYNFSPIQQGNQQVINSMAGLGQQISSAIETHAATESAKAMLPMLQQQYQAGMQRIAEGHPEGMTDIYDAAMTASQNPFLAPMAKSALTTAQSANINVQHMLRTLAYQQGRQSGDAKPMSIGTQMSAMKNFDVMDTKLQERQNEALRLGDQTTFDQIAQERESLRNSMTQAQLSVPALGAEGKGFNTASQLLATQKALKAEKLKGSEHWLRKSLNTDPEKVKELESRIQKLRTGGLPSMQGSNQAGSQIQQGNATFNSKEEVGNAFKSGQITKEQAIQLLKSFPNQ
jgi:hypothetical protein